MPENGIYDCINKKKCGWCGSEESGTKELNTQERIMDDRASYPLISIGVSTFNWKEYLRKSLNSLLAQSWKNFEIIVVDDGSTDGTGDMVAREFPEIRYCYQKNAGDAAAKNHAARLAHGEYLVFNDSDDLFLPDTLERLYAAVAADPGSCAYGWYVTIDEHGVEQPTRAKVKHFPDGEITKTLLRHIIVCNCGTLMPRELFLQQGGYDEALLCAYDYKLALQLSTVCRFHPVPGVVFKRRRHGDNLSAVNYEKQKIVLKVVEDFLTSHPEIAARYSGVANRRLSRLHNKLAREARREKRPDSVVREHLRFSLRYHFKMKTLYRLINSLLK